MTPEEVYREIDRDIESVEAWWMHRRDEQRRVALKSSRFPIEVWFDYLSPRHNRYMVLNIILGRKYNTNGLSSVFAVQKMERGHAIYFTKFPRQKLASKIVVMPHVFDRYAERCGIDKTGLEIVKHFVTHNYQGKDVRGDKFSARSVRYQGRDNLCLCTHDGVMMGEDVGGIFVARTFITYDMAAGVQRDEFNDSRLMMLTQEEYLKDCKQYY